MSFIGHIDVAVPRLIAVAREVERVARDRIWPLMIWLWLDNVPRLTELPKEEPGSRKAKLMLDEVSVRFVY